MAHTLNLSDAEMSLVMTALSAISPSGGGSAPFTLLRKLNAQTGAGFPDHQVLGRALKVAAQEFLGDDLFMELEEAGKLPTV